jgi:hypothetical protein
MSRNPFRSRRSRLAAATTFPLVVAGLSGCGVAPHPLDIAAIDVTPDKVVTASFTAQGKTADMKAADGVWSPSNGVSVQSATMLSTIQDRVFPLNAYRILSGVNQNDVAYGLSGQNNSGPDCGAVCTISAVDTAGKTWKLTVGAPTFNGAGFYAKVDNDPRVFLITQQTVADIITEALGKDFSFPENAKYKKVDDALNLVGEDKNTGPDLDPYLLQVLAADQSEQSVKAGQGPGDYVLRTATSTRGLAGAKAPKAVSIVSGSSPQSEAPTQQSGPSAPQSGSPTPQSGAPASQSGAPTPQPGARQ